MDPRKAADHASGCLRARSPQTHCGHAHAAAKHQHLAPNSLTARCLDVTAYSVRSCSRRAFPRQWAVDDAGEFFARQRLGKPYQWARAPQARDRPSASTALRWRPKWRSRHTSRAAWLTMPQRPTLEPRTRRYTGTLRATPAQGRRQPFQSLAGGCLSHTKIPVIRKEPACYFPGEPLSRMRLAVRFCLCQPSSCAAYPVTPSRVMSQSMLCSTPYFHADHSWPPGASWNWTLMPAFLISW
jgi:hypothetical protein